MSWLELMQEDPTAFVFNILVSLVITLLSYGAFPFIFSMTCNKTITKKKYYILCYAINVIVMAVFIAINREPSSGGPYALWTWVFSTLGIKTLKSRGVLEGFSSYASAGDKCEKSADNILIHEECAAPPQAPQYPSQAKISFCRHCGASRVPNGVFCNKCGERLNWK